MCVFNVPFCGINLCSVLHHRLGERSIVMSVCLCVTHEHISENTRSIFTKVIVHVTHPRGSVLIWRR